MTKDRLAEMHAAQGEESDGGVIFIEVDAAGYMDSFFLEISAANQMLDQMAEGIANMRTKYRALTEISYNDENMKLDLEKNVSEVKRISVALRAKLKELEEFKSDSSQNVSSAEERIRNSQVAALSKKFLAQLTDYNNAQVEYQEICKERIRKQMEISGKKVSKEELNEIFEMGESQIFVQDVIDTLQSRQALTDIESRHAEILKLEQDIRELKDLFCDMALLVENQGELIDRIEYQMLQTKEYVEVAKKEMKQAVRVQKKVRKKRFILIALGISILVLIIIMLMLAIILCMYSRYYCLLNVLFPYHMSHFLIT